MPEPAYVYILRCHSVGNPLRGGASGETLYTGWTVDVARRVAQHQAGKGGRYTRSHLPVELVYQEEWPTQSEAMKRECEIKKMTRAEKLALIELGRKPATRGGRKPATRGGRKPATREGQKAPLPPRPHERPPR